MCAFKKKCNAAYLPYMGRSATTNDGALWFLGGGGGGGGMAWRGVREGVPPGKFMKLTLRVRIA